MHFKLFIVYLIKIIALKRKKSMRSGLSMILFATLVIEYGHYLTHSIVLKTNP